MPESNIYPFLFATLSFFLGAAIGSFLNVCIYRMPLNLSVNEPKRSFCPHCKYHIPWHANLPLITWLAQRGKCANCKAPIAFRYFAVELLTALLFLGIWNQVGMAGEHGWTALFALWTFVSLLIVATFIDFEHFMIPDEITIGGTVAGLLFSLVTPFLHGTLSHWNGLLISLIGAASGFGLLWLISAAGKLAFGKKLIPFDPPVDFTWTLKDDSAELLTGDLKHNWMDLFSNEKDFLLMDCTRCEVKGTVYENTIIRSQYERLHTPDGEHPLEELRSFSGTIRSLSFKRDAMGFGDVKFIACIGAFLGWQAVLVSIMVASVVGSLVGLITIALRRREWSAKIPFGPYLALGALVWTFFGPQLLSWWSIYSSISAE